MSTSRTANSAKNAIFASFNILVQTILRFAVRIIFVRYLSVEYLGLNTLFSNILQVLSLAELGIGGAIVYSMYKPVADGDTEKVKALVSLYKKIYWTIGIIILVAGLALIPVLPYLMNGGTTLDVNLNIVYVIYLFNTAISYFFAHRRSLIYANQRNDIETKANSICLIALNVVQFIILAITKNYYLYVAVMPIFTVLDAFIITYASYRLFPEIRGKAGKISGDDKKALIRNTGAMIGHKIGGVVVLSTDNIFISAYISLTILGFYSNYALITAVMVQFINFAVTAIRASVGNLINTASKERVYEVFNTLNYIVYVVNVFFCSCFLAFVQDFIGVVFGGDLLLPIGTVIVITVSFYIQQSRAVIGAFRETGGLFWNDRYKPFIEVAVKIGSTFILAHYFGLAGILFATVVSNVTCNLTIEPIILYKKLFNKKIAPYYIQYFIYAFVAAGICVATYFVSNLITAMSVGMLIVKGLVCVGVSGALLLLVSIPTKEFRNCLAILRGLLSKNKEK